MNGKDGFLLYKEKPCPLFVSVSSVVPPLFSCRKFGQRGTASTPTPKPSAARRSTWIGAQAVTPDLSGMDQAPPLVGADFLTERNNVSMNDLFERVRISMPADKLGSLERQQVADVIALVSQKDGFPTGSADLPADADTLKALMFIAKKP